MEVSKNNEDESLIGDGLTDVVEGFDEGLEFRAVLRDGEIALDCCADLASS